jgi:hypothetical protein
VPDGVLKLYEAGSEGPQWWGDAPDAVRGLPAAGILDRCNASHTCPKIVEHFGAAEVWGLKLTPEWVGMSGDTDLPLPDNVRRYYIPSTSMAAVAAASAPLRRPRRPVPASNGARVRCPATRCRIPRRSMRCASISATG